MGHVGGCKVTLPCTPQRRTSRGICAETFMTTVVPSSKNSTPSFTDAVDGTSQTGQTRGHYESSLAV